MFFGRNEECGMRCVYHGWKFDRHGDCIDMPSEPAGTPLQARVKIKAYPCLRARRHVWTYMGPKDQMPAPPDYEWMRAPASHRFVSKTYEDCNWLQAMEGGLDTAHSSFAHNNDLGNKNMLRNRDRCAAARRGAARTTAIATSRRASWATARAYVRVYHYIMPAQQVRGSIHQDRGRQARLSASSTATSGFPSTTRRCFVFNTMYSYDADTPLPKEIVMGWETLAGRGPSITCPARSSSSPDKSNDYFIDRQLQKTKTFTGITGVNTQDYALQEGMGPIVDRSQENLGTSDKAIVAMRRMMLRSIDGVARGVDPPGVDPKAHGVVRPYDDYLPAGADWRQMFESELAAKW